MQANGLGIQASRPPLLIPFLAVDHTVLLSSRGELPALGVVKGVGAPGPGAHSIPTHLNSFLPSSAQLAPWDLRLTARMEVGPATKTFVLELRCLEDGGSRPDTLSGEGLGGGPLTS